MWIYENNAPETAMWDNVTQLAAASRAAALVTALKLTTSASMATIVRAVAKSARIIKIAVPR